MSHDNVTHIDPGGSPFPADSPSYFPVMQKPLYYRHSDLVHRVTDQKLIVRVNGDNVTPLAVVGANYKVIRNDEVFPYIEAQMRTYLDPHLLQGVQITDEQSYGGRDCYRHYVFPNLHTDIDGGGDVAFRLILGNSYGAKTLQLIAGAIDFFCTNGMIFGTFDRTARKHTSGLTVQGIEQWVRDSVTYFTQHTERMQQWSHIDIPFGREDDMFKDLVNGSFMSESHAAKISNDMHRERNARVGRDKRPTMWHLYSSLTAWASHGDIRNTGNDHAANTRIDRGKHVVRVMARVERFMQEAA